MFFALPLFGSLSSYNSKCSYFESQKVWELGVGEGEGRQISAGRFGSVICIIPDKQMMKAMTNSYCDTSLIISSHQSDNMSFAPRPFFNAYCIYVSFKMNHHNM